MNNQEKLIDKVDELREKLLIGRDTLKKNSISCKAFYDKTVSCYHWLNNIGELGYSKNILKENISQLHISAMESLGALNDVVRAHKELERLNKEVIKKKKERR